MNKLLLRFSRTVEALVEGGGYVVNVLSVLLVLAFALAGAGCNTVKGMGKDLQRAGQKIEDAAKK